MLVIAFGLAFLRLVLFAEVTAAALFTVQCVVSDKLAHEDEVTEVDRLVEFDVQTFLLSRNEEVRVELLTQCLQLLQTLFKTFLGSSHAHMLPHYVTEFLVDGVDRTLAVDVHQPVDFRIDGLLCLVELRTVGRNPAPESLVGKVVLDSVWQYEVAIGQSLHQCRRSQTVGTVVGEVALAD